LIEKGRRYDSGGIEIFGLPDKIDLNKVLPERPEPMIKKGMQLRFKESLVTG
jgi:hypothetical protein